MPEAAEYAIVEARISRMTDAELVEMGDHPGDYEPWAVEIGRGELARRGLAPDQLAELKAQNAAENAEATKRRKAASHHQIAWGWGLVVALVIPIVVAVVKSVTADNDSKRLSVTCAQMLAKASGSGSDRNVVRLDRHLLATTVKVEQLGELPNTAKSAAEIRVDCELDGRPVAALTSRVIGIGATREEALRDAIEMWVAFSGAPIIDAIVAKGGDFRIGAFSVHAGPTVFRGHAPDDAGDLHEAFFREVAPALSYLAADSSLHAVSVLVVWDADGTSHSDFRIDGLPSEELKQRATKVRWPRDTATRMMKQYYVLTAAAGVSSVAQ